MHIGRGRFLSQVRKSYKKEFHYGMHKLFVNCCHYHCLHALHSKEVHYKNNPLNPKGLYSNITLFK